MQKFESINISNFKLNGWQEQIITNCLLFDLIEFSDVELAAKSLKKFICPDELFEKHSEDTNTIKKALATASQL